VVIYGSQVEMAHRSKNGSEYGIRISEARRRFSEVLNRAAFGKERVVLTRHGKALVAVVPVEDLQLIRAAGDAEDLAAARAALAESGTPIPLDEILSRHGGQIPR
jgi:prevent-host-death family protein